MRLRYIRRRSGVHLHVLMCNSVYTILNCDIACSMMHFHAFPRCPTPNNKARLGSSTYWKSSTVPANATICAQPLKGTLLKAAKPLGTSVNFKPKEGDRSPAAVCPTLSRIGILWKKHKPLESFVQASWRRNGKSAKVKKQNYFTSVDPHHDMSKKPR